VVIPVTLTRFGLIITNYSYGLSSAELFERIVEVGAAVEATVFDSLWLPDHMVQGPVGDVAANQKGTERNVDGPNGRMTPMLDAPTLLSALAVTANRLRLGQFVSPVTLRNPALLAKVVTTLDVVSGGRAILGMGAGWDADEHRRYGFAFPPIAERMDRLEDAARICRAMFDEVAATCSGKYHSIDEAINMPRPVNERVPILIGGGGEKRTLRAVARYADACNIVGDVETLRHKLSVLDRHCDDVGRDPAEVSRTCGVVFHKIGDPLYRGIDDGFMAGCGGVILIPWQLPLQPDEVAAVGSRLASDFGTA
jgi:alkanesulfonate monooxygenase SsuD/methylene tetrahydromethanopterin reductase-like flavin-dependent oxidoreductase (luciferase family)